jgi:hypothetical protein
MLVLVEKVVEEPPPNRSYFHPRRRGVTDRQFGASVRYEIRSLGSFVRIIRYKPVTHCRAENRYRSDGKGIQTSNKVVQFFDMRLWRGRPVSIIDLPAARQPLAVSLRKRQSR